MLTLCASKIGETGLELGRLETWEARRLSSLRIAQLPSEFSLFIICCASPVLVYVLDLEFGQLRTLVTELIVNCLLLLVYSFMVLEKLN